MKLLENISELIVWGGLACLIAFALGLSGCAGDDALLYAKPTPRADCVVPVCEKINKRDTECWRFYCLNDRELDEMLRGQR